MDSASATSPLGALWRVWRRIYRVCLLLLHAIVGMLLQFGLLCVSPVVDIDAAEQAVTRWWQSMLCRILGLKIRIVGQPSAPPVMIAANHVSWLDIPVLGGVLPVHFLSKSEVRRWPLIGWLATMAGTIYIERGAHGARLVTGAMINKLHSGRSVVFFPEGTTTNGDTVRRFLPRLFAAAVEAEAVVQPVAIRYLHHGGPHPAAPFVNDDMIGVHLIKVVGEPKIDVEVTFCPPVRAVTERRRIAELAYEAIAGVVLGEPRGVAE